MPQRVNIDPGSVFQAAGKLHVAANKVDDGTAKAKSAFGRTGGLPPEFQGRAQALAGRMAKCAYAMDAIAVSGVELSHRGRVALGVDGGGHLGVSGPLPSKNLRAFSENLRLWNKQTRAAARTHPGKYFNDINKVLHKPEAKVPVPKAGSGGCKLYAKNGDYLRLDVKGKQSMTPAQKAKAISRKMELGRKELGVYLGYYGSAEAGGKCQVALGKGYDAQSNLIVKGQAKVGVSGTVSKTRLKVDAGFDFSAKAEARASAGKGNNRVAASGAALAGVTAKLAADVGVDERGRAHLKVSGGLALAIGLEGTVDVVVDVTPLTEEDKVRRVVPTRAPSGVLGVHQA